MPDGDGVSVPAGGTTGLPVTVEPVANAASVTVQLAAAPPLPDTECERGYGRFMPCFMDLAAAAGEPLVLFKRPPMAADVPALALDTDDATRIALASAFAAAPGEALAYAAESSDPAVAQVRVEAGELVIEALAEGAATVTVTATDADGPAATLHVEVVVTTLPRSQWRGWRLEVLNLH